MFREDKATQLAAYLIEKRGGECSTVILQAMLYACDRTMIVRRGAPVTYDTWTATPTGPVLNATHELMTGRSSGTGYWKHHLVTDGPRVSLTQAPGDDALSESEEDTANYVFALFTGMGESEAAIFAHQTFSECADAENGSYPIRPEDILQAEGILTPANLEAVRQHFELNELFFTPRVTALA